MLGEEEGGECLGQGGRLQGGPGLAGQGQGGLQLLPPAVIVCGGTVILQVPELPWLTLYKGGVVPQFLQLPHQAGPRAEVGLGPGTAVHLHGPSCTALHCAVI